MVPSMLTAYELNWSLRSGSLYLSAFWKQHSYVLILCKAVCIYNFSGIHTYYSILKYHRQMSYTLYLFCYPLCFFRDTENWGTLSIGFPPNSWLSFEDKLRDCICDAAFSAGFSYLHRGRNRQCPCKYFFLVRSLKYLGYLEYPGLVSP